MRIKILLFSLVFLGFVNGVEHTVVTASLSIFGSQFNAMSHIGWFTVSFTIASVMVSPIIGYFANNKPIKPLFRFGLLMMLIGFFVSLFADNFFFLLVGRAISGIGTGALSVLPSVLLAKQFAMERRTQTDAYFFASYTAGTFIGPIIGSLLTHQFGWQGIFVISIALISMLWILLEIGWSSLKEKAMQQKTDSSVIWQSVLFMFFLLSILLIVEFATDAYDQFSFYVLIFISLSCLIGYLRFSRRSSTPLFHPKLIKNRIFFAVITYSFLFGITKFVFTSFMPVYVMEVMGESFLFANYTLTALLIGNAIGNIIVSKMITKIAYKKIFIVSFLLQHLSFVLLLLPEWHIGAFIIALSFLLGIANGFAGYPGLLVLQYTFPRFMGSAASSNNMSRHFGGVVGIVVFQQIVLAKDITMTNFQSGFLFLWILFAILSFVIFLFPSQHLKKKEELNE